MSTRVVCKLETNENMVELVLQTTTLSTIRAAILFAEQIFAGESQVMLVPLSIILQII